MNGHRSSVFPDRSRVRGSTEYETAEHRGNVMGRLDGKIALVTGAGGGLGSAMSVAFASEGARVVCQDLDEGAAKATVDAIAAAGGPEAMASACDVSDSAAIDEMFDAATALRPRERARELRGGGSHTERRIGCGQHRYRDASDADERRGLAANARHPPQRRVLLHVCDGEASRRCRRGRFDHLHLEHRRDVGMGAGALRDREGRPARLRALDGPLLRIARHPRERVLRPA